MAAVLRREAGDEGRLPDRTKTVGEARRGETGIFRDHENNPAVLVDPQFMHVEIAGGLGVSRHVVAVEAVHAGIGGQYVFHPPYLEMVCQIEPLRRGGDAHGPHEMPFVETYSSARQAPDKIKPPGLIVGEAEAQIVLGHPVGEAARAGNLRLGFCRLRRLPWRILMVGGSAGGGPFFSSLFFRLLAGRGFLHFGFPVGHVSLHPQDC